MQKWLWFFAKSRIQTPKKNTHIFLSTRQQLVLAQPAAFGANHCHFLGKFDQLRGCQLRHLLGEAHEEPEMTDFVTLVFLFQQAAVSSPCIPCGMFQPSPMEHCLAQGRDWASRWWAQAGRCKAALFVQPNVSAVPLAWLMWPTQCYSSLGYAQPEQGKEAQETIILVLEIVISFLIVNVAACPHDAFCFVNMFPQFFLLKNISEFEESLH